MSKQYRTALFSALNIDQSLLETTEKTANWRLDDQVGSENQLGSDYYSANVWDKGHLAPDAAAGWGESLEERLAATNDTYFYTNATLQHENFNRDEWKDLESMIRKLEADSSDRLCEITGPVYSVSGTPKTIQPEGKEEARIPDGFFKVIAFVNLAQELQVQCFVIYQDQQTLEDRKGQVDYRQYQVDIPKIEELTQLVFDPIYHKANKTPNEANYSEAQEEVPNNEPTAKVVIDAAMVNPTGKDSGNEWISLRNFGEDAICLEGWKLQDQGSRSLLLDATIDADSTLTCQTISPLRLTNTGGSLSLLNEHGDLVDKAEYTKTQVKEGVAVEFR